MDLFRIHLKSAILMGNYIHKTTGKTLVTINSPAHPGMTFIWLF